MSGLLVIGLTGSFGTGKTTVARSFKKLGAKIIDADKIAHDALERGSAAYRRVVSEFGDSILDSRKNIYRKSLAEVVFKKELLLKRLCRIVHPFVIKKIREEIKNSVGAKAVVIDAPLLIETGLGALVDKLIVVSATRKNQIRRCMARFNMTQQKVFERVKNQMPLKKKIGLADFVIYNNGTIHDTERQVMNVWRRLWR